MPEPIKNYFNRAHVTALADKIKTVYPSFESTGFIDSVLNPDWDSFELKQRMRHITLNLGEFLPKDYPQAIAIIDQVMLTLADQNYGMEMYFPDFVEVYGMAPEYYDISTQALARYTKATSAEFAIRPFIIQYEEKALQTLMEWTTNESEDIRRLASEGCRPALPWAQALPKYKQDPTPILPILEALKADPSKFVQKSVANNLNDISKTHPALVTKIAADWYGNNPITDWIVKHACRSLLKQGSPEVLAIFGFADAGDITVTDFAIKQDQVAVGGSLDFTFKIAADKPAKVRLEYAIDYVKANGKLSRKIFQISEIDLPKGKAKDYVKTHKFVDVSVRKHYPGTHQVALIVNGLARGVLAFELI